MRDDIMVDWTKYESAEQAYIRNSNEIAKQIDQMQAWHDSNFGIKDDETIHWGHVGSLKNISESLDYALEWKQQQDEKNDK
tara:strand:- start:387 stop:629 length:243 start_codon:yes stop_codon:yes gene_type:complete